MDKQKIENILNICIDKGVDFAEIYYENRRQKSIILRDSKLDAITSSNLRGIGIRIIVDNIQYYANTNDLEMDNLIKLTNNLCSNIKNKKVLENISLKNIEDKTREFKLDHQEYPLKEKIQILKKTDELIRNYSKYVSQVETFLLEEDTDFLVANTNKKYIKSNDILTRYICTCYVEKDGLIEKSYKNHGSALGYDFLDNFNYQDLALESVQNALESLDAVNFKGGELPVILGNGFGGVIFHEACVHGLEATSVATGLSVFKDDLNKQIASPKVTIIDDGTIIGEWGSSLIDSEGNLTKKNVLIENGILKSFLVDYFNSFKMNHKITGSSRRNNYHFAPTSRMNNTYLDKGTDSFESMLKSIKLGVYCKTMNGGSVEPSTGDFNFAVDDAFIIENGKIGNRIKGITLIGNSKEILNKVEMISDDLTLSSGYCGSKSGMVPVTVGQPTIKISKILVGGRE